MISSVINRKGVVRINEFTRTNEFIFCVMIGTKVLVPEREESDESVRWASLRRFENSSRRHGPQPRPDQFYPIYVGVDSGRIEMIGPSIPLSASRESVANRDGCITVWPIAPDGTEMIWGLTPASMSRRLDAGYVKVIPGRTGKGPTIYYLTSGQVHDIEEGRMLITGRDADGSARVEFAVGKAKLPTTQWDRDSHNAQSHGTGVLAALIPQRRFPFPKSLYAVEDTLRFFIGEKPRAVVIDFFAGSGRTGGADSAFPSPTTKWLPTNKRHCVN